MSDAELGNSTCIINFPVRISVTEVSYLSLTNAETLIFHSPKLGINQEQCHASPQCYFMSERRLEECLMLRFTRDFSMSWMPKCLCELRLECLRSLMKKKGGGGEVAVIRAKGMPESSCMNSLSHWKRLASSSLVLVGMKESFVYWCVQQHSVNMRTNIFSPAAIWGIYISNWKAWMESQVSVPMGEHMQWQCPLQGSPFHGWERGTRSTVCDWPPAFEV